VAPYIVATLPIGPIELSARLDYLFSDVDLATDLDINQLDFDSSASAEDWTYGSALTRRSANGSPRSSNSKQRMYRD
jgi:hypothetical protein